MTDGYERLREVTGGSEKSDLPQLSETSRNLPKSFPTSSSGYLLLEVFLAIFILAVGATSSIQVFSRTVQTQRRLEDITLGKFAAEEVLFDVVTGRFAGLFAESGGWEKGNLRIARGADEEVSYEVASEPLNDPPPKGEKRTQNDYYVNVKIANANGREIYQTSMMVHHEE